MIQRIATCILLCALLGSAAADVFQPAYLELRDVGADEYDVLWKVPVLGNDLRLAAHVDFPSDTRQLSKPWTTKSGAAWVARFRIMRDGGLVGQTVSIRNIGIGVTDVIVRIMFSDGTSQVERLLSDDPRFVVRSPAGTRDVAWSYLALGVEHILGGIDHLLFILALLLIVRGARRIFLTITAFTLAHSVTLVAASLGWVDVPGPPVEAIIALSIVFVAAEIVRNVKCQQGLTARAPWAVAFVFGLLHGLGFAGALAEIGLPQNAIPVALLLFNVGVELGQLAFVVGVLSLGAVLDRILVGWRVQTSGLEAYCIGSIAAFWVLERMLAFIP